MKRARPVLPKGIYGMTAEKFSCGRSNLETVARMLDNGVSIIQYREKRPFKSFLEIYKECKQIREMTAKAGALFIVNDYTDIARQVGADGVHVGQDDLPVEVVRELVGEEMIIGLSTHSPEQARAAVAAGADYIGVGPIFATQTKDDVCAPVGFSYLDYVVANLEIPFVAIGGIKAHNIGEVVRRGAKTVCLVTDIVGADDMDVRIKDIHQQISVHSCS